MEKIWTLPACFAHFGVVTPHRHFSLSAVSSDGKTVVVAMWEDEFERQGNRIIYQSRYRPIFKGKLQRISTQWIANLKWACRYCDCLVAMDHAESDDQAPKQKRFPSHSASPVPVRTYRNPRPSRLPISATYPSKIRDVPEVSNFAHSP